MIKIRITGAGSYVLMTAIAKQLREIGLTVAEWMDTKPSEIPGIARRTEVRGHDVLITVAEEGPP